MINSNVFLELPDLKFLVMCCVRFRCVARNGLCVLHCVVYIMLCCDVLCCVGCDTVFCVRCVALQIVVFVHYYTFVLCLIFFLLYFTLA